MANKYFVSYGLGEFSVIYLDWCEYGGNYWATAADGFKTEREAQDHADRLNEIK